MVLALLLDGVERAGRVLSTRSRKKQPDSGDRPTAADLAWRNEPGGAANNEGMHRAGMPIAYSRNSWGVSAKIRCVKGKSRSPYGLRGPVCGV